MLTGKIVRVRWVKPYQEAHNHVAIGEVQGETPSYLLICCKTYHFGSAVGSGTVRLVSDRFVGGVVEGDRCVRAVPWSRIEVIHELPADTLWDVEALTDEAGCCWLNNKHKTAIAGRQGRQSV